MPKRGLGKNVLEAAKQRLTIAFNDFTKLYVSFSGGKDSTVLLHLAADMARERDRTIGMLFIDLEAQFKLTIDHIQETLDMHADVLDPYWVSLPLNLRNAVSQYEPHWTCWDPEREDDWVRTPPSNAITDPDYFPFFTPGMEFEDFTPAFGHWYADGDLTAALVGIRSDESLNRYRSLAGDKTTYEEYQWTTWTGQSTYNVYPLYDWRTEDIWTYHGKTGEPYNHLYDRMHQAGLSIHQQRICQPYGDDQRKGLWLYHAIEPETWGKVVSRVNGANMGAKYAQETGNINGTIKIEKPPGHTWESFAKLLLESMPQKTKDHYKNKIAVFLKWWSERGYPDGDIPDTADPDLENKKKAPSWRRICKTLLRNDYWCKGLSFSQHKSGAYERYHKVMKERRKKWNLL